jgi:hypothetical protein
MKINQTLLYVLAGVGVVAAIMYFTKKSKNGLGISGSATVGTTTASAGAGVKTDKK